MKLSLLTVNVFEKSPRKNAVRTVTCHHCLEDDQNGLIIDVGADLPNTIDDARGLADVLKGPTRCVYLPELVLLLTGEASSRSGLAGRP